MKKLLLALLITATTSAAHAGILRIEHHGVYDLHYQVVKDGEVIKEDIFSFLNKGESQARISESSTTADYIRVRRACLFEGWTTFHVPGTGTKVVKAGGNCFHPNFT